MSMWSEVVESLQPMGLWQLFFAFVACTGYALAQGRLVERRAKGWALTLTALSVLAFVLETERWVDGVVLIAVGLAGFGVFVAMVWLASRLLGLAAGMAPRSSDSLLTTPPADPGPPTAAARPLASAAPSH